MVASTAIKVGSWAVDVSCRLAGLELGASRVTELRAHAWEDARLGGRFWLLQSEGGKENP